MSLEVIQANINETKKVEHLLEECKLSIKGLNEHIHNFYLAKLDNKIIGSVGIEIYGKYGVIRSTAVLPEHRKKGIGAKLAGHMLDYAREKGIEELYLKTENEATFFKSVGFIGVSPDHIPEEVRHSEMLAESCCSTADTMFMSLCNPSAVDESAVNKAVKDKYANLANKFASSSGLTSCCSSEKKSAVSRDLYEFLPDDIPVDAFTASLGCGNPTFLAQIQEGEIILDLGSGGGLDVFLSSKKTGPTGKVYGLDMTDEMLQLARRNQEKAGVKNVEFLKGHIEDIPLPASFVDLIISNCVINLSSNKDKVLAEAFRVLKPEGRFAISDIVFLKEIPPVLKKNMEAWAGCISGALERDEYLEKLKNAGFDDITIETTRTYELPDFEKYPGFGDLSDEEKKNLEGAMTASFVKAKKPALKQVALISTYETGFQPLLVSTAGASFIKNGITPDAYDLYLDKCDRSGIASYKFVGIGLGLFDSLEGGFSAGKEIRGKNPQAHICFYGPYASLNRERLLECGDSCIIGDWEKPIVELANAVLKGEEWTRVENVYSRTNKSPKFKFYRDECLVPARHLLPSVRTYQNTFIEKVVNKKMMVGNVETTRGCHHTCKFCSVFAVSGTRVKFIDEAVIMADVDQLVQEGVEHITFVDAEYINSIKFSLAIVNKIHEKYPHMTYDFTTRVDHITENEDAIPEFKRTGCIAITTSIEFPAENILEKLRKEITLDQVIKAMDILKRNGIQVNTTFVTFNPWTGLEGLMDLAIFIKENNLGDVIDPIQYETRLHLYKGSPLLDDEALANVELTEREFHWEWEHPDARVEEVFQKMARPVGEGEFKRCCVRC